MLQGSIACVPPAPGGGCVAAATVAAAALLFFREGTGKPAATAPARASAPFDKPFSGMLGAP